jgi:hypothetical protein
MPLSRRKRETKLPYPTLPDEPLKNIELESAVLGLRMTLTPEEEIQARSKFLEMLRVSSLAVPTLTPVPLGPDGAVLPNAEINLLVVNTQEGVTGVPAFTTLAGLRAALPDVENGMLLTGADLGNILGSSGHKLFVDGPDLHAEVESEELQQLAFITHQFVAQQQQDAQHNQRLEDALAAYEQTSNREYAEAVVQAFLQGHCRYPIAGEGDANTEALVISRDAEAGGPAIPEIALLTLDGALISFTSEETLRSWDQTPRNSILLDGPMVAQLSAQAELEQIRLNPGSVTARTLTISQGQLQLS